MKRKVFIILFSLLFLSVFSLHGQQDIKISKSDLGPDRKKIAKGWKYIKDGENLYEKGINYYPKALRYYLQAYHIFPNNALLNYKIGICFFFTFHKKQSLPYFNKASRIDPDVSKDIRYFLGRALHFNLKFKKAIDEYMTYKEANISYLSKQEHFRIERLIRQCQAGQALMKNPARAFIENAGSVINSEYTEFRPLIPSNGSILYFNVHKTDAIREDISSFLLNNEVYYSKCINEQWQEKNKLQRPINPDNQIVAVGLSYDGNRLFLLKPDYGGDIFVSERKKKRWSAPDALNRNINSKYTETSITFAPDNLHAYFVSNRNDMTYGEKDIYISSRKENRKRWKNTQNIGPHINTEYDEEGVYMHSDGKTLYFSSKGHNTMGGFDIFRSVYDEKTGWSKPENLGYPINTPYDELYFMLTGDGKSGYFCSSREGGYGKFDIYKVVFPGPEKEMIPYTENDLFASLSKPAQKISLLPAVEIKTKKEALIKGMIKNFRTLRPIQANIKVINLKTQKTVNTTSSNPQTGRFTLTLPFGKEYGMTMTSEDYLFHTEYFNTIDTGKTYFEEINLDIRLTPVKAGSKLILKNTHFKPGSIKPVKESASELDRLVNLMKKYPGLKIKISGHTDNSGSLQANLNLSEKRAQSIANYLTSKGIDKNRMQIAGYAYLKPIASNDTEEGRRKNRRIEVLILDD